MLIVLEGPDGSGKSTLAKRLARILNARVIHCTKDTPNDYDYFQRILFAAREENVIADRFCYGQFVYQDRKDRRLSKEQLYRLEADMLHDGAKVIYVTASSKTLTRRLNQRKEIPMHPVEDLVAGFDKLLLEESTLQVEVWRT